MISVIICSRSPSLLAQVSANVQDTIGIPYEILPIDNSAGKYSICKAYNLGASQSRYELLCFMHEDILFRTRDWGKTVALGLEKDGVGAVGVAGATVKLQTPTPWFITDQAFWRKRIIQHYEQGVHVLDELNNPHNQEVADVVVLDGVWICCRKKVWEENRFDSNTFKEFHFYDLDFTLQLFQKGFKVQVLYNVLIEHLSEGSLNASWVLGAQVFSRKWKPQLPVSVEYIGADQIKKMESDNGKYFLNLMLLSNVPARQYFAFGLQYLYRFPGRPNLKWLVKNFMKSRPSKSLKIAATVYQIFSGAIPRLNKVKPKASKG